MKREDFGEEDLQGMLIAYLDDQMETAEKAEFEKLLSQHEDLRADLEIFRKTSSKIEELFQMDGVEAPNHIFAQALDLAKEFNNNSNARSNTLFGKSAESSNKAAPGQSFNVSQKVVSISEKNGRNNSFFSFMSLTQMAAALTLGFFLGPQILQKSEENNQVKTKRSVGLEIPQGTGFLLDDGIIANSRIDIENMISGRNKSKIGFQFSPVNDGIDRLVGTPYNIDFLSPLTGRLVVELNIDKSRISQTEKKLFDGEIRAGEIVNVTNLLLKSIDGKSTSYISATITAPTGEVATFKQYIEYLPKFFE